MNNWLFILAIAVIVLVYLPAGYFFFQRRRVKTARDKFFTAANSILNRNMNDSVCISEFLLTYKKTVQFSQSPSMPYKNAADFVEELIYAIDTLDLEAFKTAYGFIKTEDMRNRLANIHTTLKQMQPYASVSTSYAGLLETLSKALDGENPELGKLSLGQLTENIAALENTLQYQSQVNLVAMVSAIAGFLLSLVLAVTLIVS